MSALRAGRAAAVVTAVSAAVLIGAWPAIAYSNGTVGVRETVCASDLVPRENPGSGC
ncbi:hypothetical protein ACIBJF_44240 [Streptomyces sp. NPDC050743]|uniref:hypothetical protein n=1 Tax=Streptomyces sp. NPDC050743 TaxID=3365634 RepID=UPI0037921BAE